MKRIILFAIVATLFTRPAAAAGDLIPPGKEIRADHPRLLLRPQATPRAISIAQLKAIPRDENFNQMVAYLRGQNNAACQAMVYLLTGDRAAAEQAVKRMSAFVVKDQPDSFDVFFGLREMALAYDWLYDFDGFPAEARGEVRRRLAPLAAAGLKISDDHLIHNYIWQAAGGATLWALATAGDDAEADKLLAVMRDRLNQRLYPGMQYLDGAPGESMWYWALYDLSPCALTVLAAQSAFEADLVGTIKKDQGDWLTRQLDYVIHNTQPDMTYVSFGDTKTGPDGGVTHEMAGVLDGLTWATQSPQGAWFSQWIDGKRGLKRFFGFHSVFYFLYTRNIAVAPQPPGLAFRAGGADGGQVIARTGWDDRATVLGFRCTDHFGDHNHFDQGSFTIFRLPQGQLAGDPTTYKKVGGPQQATTWHSTLLINGQGQRTVHGQTFKTLDELKANMAAGAKLDTGAMLYFADAVVPLQQAPGKTVSLERGSYTTMAGQFAQAYPEGLLASCTRQITLIRPGTVVVIDRLEAPAGKSLESVTWQLITAGAPTTTPEGLATVENGPGGGSLRCWGNGTPAVEAGAKPWHRVCYAYPAKGGNKLTLVHVLEVGDGPSPEKPPRPVIRAAASAWIVELVVPAGRVWRFGGPAADKPGSPDAWQVTYCADEAGGPGF